MSLHSDRILAKRAAVKVNTLITACEKHSSSFADLSLLTVGRVPSLTVNPGIKPGDPKLSSYILQPLPFLSLALCIVRDQFSCPQLIVSSPRWEPFLINTYNSPPLRLLPVLSMAQNLIPNRNMKIIIHVVLKSRNCLNHYFSTCGFCPLMVKGNPRSSPWDNSSKAST